jgi:hypothetical protein
MSNGQYYSIMTVLLIILGHVAGLGGEHVFPLACYAIGVVCGLVALFSK